MVRVSIEVPSEAARFRVGVQDKSIRRAVCLVSGSYSASDVRIVFLLDPEGFFVEDVGAQGEQIKFEEPQKMCGLEERSPARGGQVILVVGTVTTSVTETNPKTKRIALAGVLSRR